MALTWAPSASKHGVDQDDAIHAITHAVYVEIEFDEPRPPNQVRPTLYIGPQRTRGAPLLEVMAEISPPRDMHIFHVMEARQKHLSRMQAPEGGDRQ